MNISFPPLNNMDIEDHRIVIGKITLSNGILGRPGICALGAVPSTAHGMIKFPTRAGVATIRTEQLFPHRHRKRAICEVLKANLDVFAWKLADMTGVPRTLAEHKLGVKEGTPPVRQKK
ncbi:hypothetical protein Tco_0762954 [Tanacetum coccineum]